VSERESLEDQSKIIEELIQMTRDDLFKVCLKQYEACEQ
jgi:hypothetical protein